MQVSDIIGRMGGLKSMAQELGISEKEASSGAAALAPAVLGGFKKKAQADPSGIGGLEGLIGKLGGGDLLDNVTSSQPTDVNKGNNVLGEIFGSKDVSRAVAQDASEKSGIDSSTLKKMLPMVAMMVTGYMAKERTPVGAGKSSGSLLGLAGDDDNNPLDDVMRKLGRR